MKENVKIYYKKQFQDIKSNPKNIIKKWWFWLILIACIWGPILEKEETQKKSALSENSIQNNMVQEQNLETEEEKLAREEKEKKEAEEKALEDAKKERQKRIEENSLNAYVYTEKLVKDNLKAPSTAKFSNSKYGYNEEYSRYIISGSVDSQNSFGAMLRTDFYAEYDQDVNLIYFVIDNNVLLDER